MQLQLARLLLHWRCCLTFAGTLSTLGSVVLNGVQQEELPRVFLGLDALMTASLSLSLSLTWPSWWWLTPLVSSQIPVRFLTWKLWTSVPLAWRWPGKSMIMSHLQSIPTRYKLWVRQVPSISQSRRLMPSSLHSAQAPCTTSRCILSLMTVPRARQASSKFTPVSPLMALLAFLPAGCVSDARQTLFLFQGMHSSVCGPTGTVTTFKILDPIMVTIDWPCPPAQHRVTCFPCAVSFNVHTSVTWLALASFYGWGIPGWERCCGQVSHLVSVWGGIRQLGSLGSSVLVTAILAWGHGEQMVWGGERSLVVTCLCPLDVDKIMKQDAAISVFFLLIRVSLKDKLIGSK